MARELVNLSTENEKLREKTRNYPVLHEQFKVNDSFHPHSLSKIPLGIGKTL